MIILLGLLMATILGYVLVREVQHEGVFMVGVLLLLGGGVCLLMGLIGLPINHMENRAKIQEFESVRSTVEIARAADVGIETAAFQLKIAEMNQWLANVQYWNNTAFSLWIPNAVDTLEPIR
jgi:hypothetical protein